MSYGVWKRRGKGWSSIEVDSPGNGASLYDLQDMDPVRYKNLIYRLNRAGLQYSHMDDYNQLAWEQGQITRYPSRGIRSFSRSDHSVMIASDDKDVMAQAMKTLGLEPEDLEVPINNI